MAPYLAFFAAGHFEVRQGLDHGLPVAGRRLPGAAPRRPAPRSMRLMRRTPGIVHWLQHDLGPLPVLDHRRAHHEPESGLRAGEPDPADLRRVLPLGEHRGARAGPPVVRRLRVRGGLARHLAQRGGRDLHGGAVRRDPRRLVGPDLAAEDLRRVRRRRVVLEPRPRRPGARPPLRLAGLPAGGHDAAGPAAPDRERRLLAVAAPVGGRPPRAATGRPRSSPPSPRRSAARTSRGSSRPGCATRAGPRGPPRTASAERRGRITRAGAPTGRSRTPRASRTR